jgi:serine protease Do
MSTPVPRLLPALLGLLPALAFGTPARADTDLPGMHWEHRVFLVVADGGPARVPFKRLVEDPEGFFWRRRVGCAVYMGDRRYLLTTRSVVGDNSIVEIFNDEGVHVVARIVGTDRHLDLALLESVEDLPRTADLKPLEAGPQLVAGAPCMVLGSAYGEPLAATRGTLAEHVMVMSTGVPVPLRHVDVPIFPGDSGGPVLDPDGRFLGLVTAVSVDGGGDSPVLERSGELTRGLRTQPAASSGFAVPAETCLRVWTDLRDHGRVRRGFLGVQMALDDDADRIGAEVRRVMAGSPADAVGIRPGDRILQFDRKVVTDPRQFFALVASTPPGKQLDLLVERDHTDLTVAVQLGEVIRRPARGSGTAEPTEPTLARPVATDENEDDPPN